MVESVRAMSAEERRLVERLLEPLGGAAAPFRAQLDGARVRSSCACGCPSFDFAGVGAGPRRNKRGGPLTTGFAETTDGRPIGLILWRVEDSLAGLELYPYDDGGPFDLSDLATVSPNEPGD